MEFIYIFNDDDKRVLDSLGLIMVYSGGSQDNPVYIYKNNPIDKFESIPDGAIYSNTMLY